MNFERRVIFNSWIVDTIALGLILFYSLFSARIPTRQAFDVIKFVVPIVFFFLFIAGPVFAHLTYRGTARKLEEFEAGRGNEKFRTDLLQDLHRHTQSCFFTTIAYFLCSFLIAFIIMKGGCA